MTAGTKDPERKPNVLLVDDDEDLRKVFSAGLEKKGFKVVSAGSADEAIRAAADPEVEIDVIVMDIVLPDSWGSQVAMEQGLFRPEVKVIYISGYSREDAVLQASSGNEEVHFLPKPFTVEELGAKIRAVLGGAPGGRGETEPE